MTSTSIQGYAKADDVDFDCPFQITADSKVIEVEGVRAPSVYHVEGAQHPDDIDIQAGSRGDRWEALSGFTGQHSYRGACMHASEFIGGGLEDYLLAHPGVYVVTSVEVLGEPDADENEEPAGWAILRYLGHDDGCQYCAAGEASIHNYEPKKVY